MLAEKQRKNKNDAKKKELKDKLILVANFFFTSRQREIFQNSWKLCIMKKPIHGFQTHSKDKLSSISL